jgi:uncharacterized membrane protein HdeD (DUF308 family)
MIVSVYVADPLFLSMIIGVFLILAGIMEIFIVPTEEQKSGD